MKTGVYKQRVAKQIGVLLRCGFRPRQMLLLTRLAPEGIEQSLRVAPMGVSRLRESLPIYPAVSDDRSRDLRLITLSL